MEAITAGDLITSFEEQDKGDRKDTGRVDLGGLVEGDVICAICLEKILIQETALVKGCEHAYCLTCILRWATYKENPSCPQCKNSFDSLNVHRSLDGCLHDYMFEESVCLLLRACWFNPLVVEAHDDACEEEDLFHLNYNEYNDENDEDDEEEDESYFTRNSSGIRIGNRRWGDNGFVRAGRKEARPLNRQSNFESESSSQSKKEEASSSSTPSTGRRAKRALKREAADKAAAAKHQQHLQRLGLK